jgi:broad specificity phosphatase PhoE
MIRPMQYLTIDRFLDLHATGGVTLFVRHAERYPLQTFADVFQAGLTDGGIRQSISFGQRLASQYRIGSLITSPIQRCVDTARHLLDGAGLDIPIQAHWWLFSPFLRSKNGHAEGVRMYSGESVTVYDRHCLNILLRRVKAPSETGVVNLVIAHDTTVLPILAYLLGYETVTTADNPGFLEGIALQCAGDRLELANPEHYQIA